MRRRFTPINWIQWLTLALATVSTGAFLILYLQIEHVQEHQNDALHSIICFAEQRVETATTLTTQARRQALSFYTQALADAHLDPCQGGNP